MHGPTARPLPLPYLQIINPLEGFVGAEDQASNKPADMFKSFRTTKDLSKTFHPLGQDLGHPNNRQHGSTLSFSISFFLSSSIHPFFPITFQVVLDREQRHRHLTQARRFWQEATLICVTHDVGETRSFGRVVVVEGGHIVEDRRPEELAAAPSSRYRALLDREESLRQ